VGQERDVRSGCVRRLFLGNHIPKFVRRLINMKTRAIMALVTVAGAAAAANAQTGGQATYSLQFSNGTNSITLTAGQSTSVSVFVSFTPGIGSQYGTAAPLQGEILGLNNGGFSITGAGVGTATGNFGVLAGTGHPSLTAPYNFLPGVATNQGTSAGNSQNGVLWGHQFIFSPVHPLPANPAKVWEGTFTMGAGATNGQINLSFTGMAATGVDVSSGPPSAGAIPWVADFASNAGAGGTILVPAPASLALLGLGGLVALRRRR
jgi:hypothetical protein